MILSTLYTNNANQIIHEHEHCVQTAIPGRIIQELIDMLDRSGDGALQLDEFVTLDEFQDLIEDLMTMQPTVFPTSLP